MLCSPEKGSVSQSRAVFTRKKGVFLRHADQGQTISQALHLALDLRKAESCGCSVFGSPEASLGSYGLGWTQSRACLWVLGAAVCLRPLKLSAVPSSLFGLLCVISFRSSPTTWAGISITTYKKGICSATQTGRYLGAPGPHLFPPETLASGPVGMRMGAFPRTLGSYLPRAPADLLLL